MKQPFLLLIVALLGSHAAIGAPEWIAALRSPDVETRRAAVDEIQTLDDARIPEACLPLLRDPGDSIRRQAARAIGSRFHQIPARRTQEFVAALRRCAEEGPEDVTLLAKRAIGLLTRRADSPAFSRSPDGRWVLYEQRRLPVIADRRFRRRQILSLVHPDPIMVSHDDVVRRGNIEPLEQPTQLLKLMVTNEPVDELFRARWHPDSDALALTPRIQRRFYTPIAIWRARDGQVRTWSARSFAKLYKKPFPHAFPHWGTTTEFVRWHGRKAIIKVYDVDAPGPGEPFDPEGILVSIDIDTWKVALEESR